MSGDWSYLIEFGFGVILIAIVIGVELLVIMHTLTATAIVAAVLATFLSLVNIELCNLRSNGAKRARATRIDINVEKFRQNDFPVDKRQSPAFTVSF